MPSIHEARREEEKPPLPVLATPPQVAEYLRTSVAALSQDRYHRKGIPYVKYGSRVLYRWADVQEYVNNNTVDPGAA
ncbi:hypothetical protein SAMN05445060_3919 [Williamsia sterculiae]|uniref:Helix-turn-helix domain-containing protein n=1 Tax=Williamsia sterculiae TaxID=1344003 RepID=A0A1N7HBC5_9NOCA|nr:hypothetical protein SAMN05445060_3919 [Williamsia sterculiae]